VNVPQDTPVAAAWPVFVISLADAQDRRRRILDQCAAIGIVPLIVDAVDGRSGLPPDRERQVDRAGAQARAGRPLSDAELACALSHQQIHQWIVSEGLPGAVILEDDAILTPLFALFLQGGGHLAGDFVQMDHMDARVWYARRRQWSPEIALIPLAENASLATGYCLSARGARHVLAHATPVAGLADWPCDMSPLGAVVTWPRLVDHPPFATSGSAIEAGRRALVAGQAPPQDRQRRFLRADYWRRWWFKRRTRKIS
jgi:glycosyl transferase family 25